MTTSLLTDEQQRIARIYLQGEIAKLETVNTAARRAYRDMLPPNIQFEVEQRETQIVALATIVQNLGKLGAVVETAPAAAKRVGKVKA